MRARFELKLKKKQVSSCFICIFILNIYIRNKIKIKLEEKVFVAEPGLSPHPVKRRLVYCAMAPKWMQVDTKLM